MAKIQHLLDKIRTAIYGKEVRGSLADGLEAINKETEDATEVAVNVEQRQDAVEQQFDDVLNEWTSDKPISNEETIAARTNRNTGENHQTLGQRLDAENKKVSAQLAETGYKIGNQVKGIKQQQAMFCFIDDDGRDKVLDTWLPLLQTKNFKLDLAIITSYPNNNPYYLDWDQLKYLTDNYNVDLLNHMHTDVSLPELSETQIIKEFEQSIQTLYSRGYFSGDILVYPRGRSTHENRILVSKYFRGAIFNLGGMNTLPLNMYNLRRINLFDGQNAMKDIDTLKGYVDKALEDKALLIFMSHSQFSGFDGSVVSDLIDYINSKNGKWVHANEAINEMGNVVHIGDNEDRYEDGVPRKVSYPYKIIDALGVTHSNFETMIGKLGTYADFNTPQKDFPRDKPSFSYVTTSNPTVANFPGGPGVLITFHGNAESFSYQIYIPNGKNDIYMRRWSNNSWGEFEKVGEEYPIKSSVTINTPPKDFDSGKTSVSLIPNVDSDGFPEGAGTLLTYRHGGYQYNYQTYKPVASNSLYIRSSNSDGSGWGDFSKS